MLLSFVDESFKGNFYGFAAVIVDEHATKALTKSLNRVMVDAMDAYGIPHATEIHGYPMFHGTEGWKKLGARARIAVYEDVIDAILAEDVTILMRAIHSDKLIARQRRENYPEIHPPEQVCFLHILQRVDKVATNQGHNALIIADERDDRERHRERFAMYQNWGTPGVYMRSTLSTLLDTVHFAPSHHSRLLQAADILAYTFQRRLTVNEPDPRAQAVMDRLWGKILASHKVYDMGSWPT